MEFESMSIDELWTALEDAKEERNDFECGLILALLCKRFGQRSEYQKSINVGYAGLEYFRKAGDGQGEAQLLYNISVGHSKVGEWLLIIPLMEKAVELNRTHGTDYQMGKALAFLASALHHIEKCDRALELWADASRFFDTEEDWADESVSTYLESGDCLEKQLKFAPAIEKFELARQGAAKIESEWLAYKANLRLGHTWAQLENYALSAEHCQKALDIAEFLNDPLLRVESSASLGQALNHSNRFKKAEKILHEALKLKHQQRWLNTSWIKVDLEYAHALAGLGRKHEAKKFYKRLRTVYAETGRLTDSYLCSFKLATLMSPQKRDKAIALLEIVVKESSKVEGLFVPRASRIHLAELLQQTGDSVNKKHALELLSEVPEEYYEDFGEYSARYQKVKELLDQDLGESNV